MLGTSSRDSSSPGESWTEDNVKLFVKCLSTSNPPPPSHASAHLQLLSLLPESAGPVPDQQQRDARHQGHEGEPRRWPWRCQGPWTQAQVGTCSPKYCPCDRVKSPEIIRVCLLGVCLPQRHRGGDQELHLPHHRGVVVAQVDPCSGHGETCEFAHLRLDQGLDCGFCKQRILCKQTDNEISKCVRTLICLGGVADHEAPLVALGEVVQVAAPEHHLVGPPAAGEPHRVPQPGRHRELGHRRRSCSTHKALTQN